jgi:predicted Zn-dependent protease with MMP-like domain
MERLAIPAQDGPAPDAAAIERLARATVAALPAAFAARLGALLLVVEELADDDTLDEMGVDDPFALTGLYRGVPLTAGGAEETGTAPGTIHLYRRAILDEWAETSVRLDELVANVVIHEIGHHFGLSDDDIAALERA